MTAKIRSLLLRLRDDHRGLTTVEYAIVLCLIAAVVVTTWQKFGSEVKDRLVTGTDRINGEMKAGLDKGK
jgi:Flp pilus assembly pilin Flp